MCRFASLVLTRDSEHWVAGVDSHELIIDRCGLHADGARGPNILRGELTPPMARPTAGDGDITVVRWHDGSRARLAVGYVGEDGIRAGVPYRMVRAEALGGQS